MDDLQPVDAIAHRSLEWMWMGPNLGFRSKDTLHRVPSRSFSTLVLSDHDGMRCSSWRWALLVRFTWLGRRHSASSLLPRRIGEKERNETRDGMTSVHGMKPIPFHLLLLRSTSPETNELWSPFARWVPSPVSHLTSSYDIRDFSSYLTRTKKKTPSS